VEGLDRVTSRKREKTVGEELTKREEEGEHRESLVAEGQPPAREIVGERLRSPRERRAREQIEKSGLWLVARAGGHFFKTRYGRTR
jgi:hypothetical protein